MPAGASLYVWLAVWEQASQRVIERRKQLGTGSLPHDLHSRTFTSGSLLGGQRGLDFLDDGIQHLQIEVHTQLQSTRRNEIGHGGKFSHVERVFVAMSGLQHWLFIVG